MNFLIVFGAQYLYLVIVLTSIVYIYRQPREQQKKIILCAVIALPVTYLVAKIAGLFYYDARPFIVENFTPLLSHANDNGFPSDHTLLSSAIATVIFIFNRKVGVALIVIAFLVGMARVFAGIHHLTDIFGSIIIAIIVTYIVFEYIFPEVWEKFSQKYLKAPSSFN